MSPSLHSQPFPPLCFCLLSFTAASSEDKDRLAASDTEPREQTDGASAGDGMATAVPDSKPPTRASPQKDNVDTTQGTDLNEASGKKSKKKSKIPKKKTRKGISGKGELDEGMGEGAVESKGVAMANTGVENIKMVKDDGSKDEGFTVSGTDGEASVKDEKTSREIFDQMSKSKNDTDRSPPGGSNLTDTGGVDSEGNTQLTSKRVLTSGLGTEHPSQEEGKGPGKTGDGESDEAMGTSKTKVIHENIEKMQGERLGKKPIKSPESMSDSHGTDEDESKISTQKTISMTKASRTSGKLGSEGKQPEGSSGEQISPTGTSGSTSARSSKKKSSDENIEKQHGGKLISGIWTASGEEVGINVKDKSNAGSGSVEGSKQSAIIKGHTSTSHASGEIISKDTDLSEGAAFSDGQGEGQFGTKSHVIKTVTSTSKLSKGDAKISSGIIKGLQEDKSDDEYFTATGEEREVYLMAEQPKDDLDKAAIHKEQWLSKDASKVTLASGASLSHGKGKSKLEGKGKLGSKGRMAGLVTTTTTTTTSTTTTAAIFDEGEGAVGGATSVATATTVSTVTSSSAYVVGGKGGKVLLSMHGETGASETAQSEEELLLSRVCRAAVPLQMLMMILLGFACLVPMSEEEFSCALRGGLDSTLAMMRRYGDGPPPT